MFALTVRNGIALVKRKGQLCVCELLFDHSLLVDWVGRVDRELDDLLTVRQVADAESGAKHLSRIERTVVQNERVHEDHFLDVDEPGLLCFPTQFKTLRIG